MKHVFLSFVLILMFFMSLAKDNYTKLWISKDPKGMHFIPPGNYTFKDGETEKTLSINGFWMSNEITNREFREFTDDLKAHPDSSFAWYDFNNKTEDGSYVIKKILYSDILNDIIDNSVWKNVAGFENYFTEKYFNDYPVTGVSYNSAKYYCWWKSKKENYGKKHDFLVEYRLPVETEWKYAASGGKTNESYTYLSSGKPEPVKKGTKNPFGLTHFSGNVSEFVLSGNPEDEVIIKGGSWKEELAFNSIKTVNKGFRDNATGFRIVRTFIGKKQVDRE